MAFVMGLGSQALPRVRFVWVEMPNQPRKDADSIEIAQIAERDPGVIVKALAMADSMAAANQTIRR